MKTTLPTSPRGCSPAQQQRPLTPDQTGHLSAGEAGVAADVQHAAVLTIALLLPFSSPLLWFLLRPHQRLSLSEVLKHYYSNAG